MHVLMNSFIFFFMTHEATRYIRYQSCRQYKGDMMEMESKLYHGTITRTGITCKKIPL